MIVETDDKSYGAEGVVTWVKNVPLGFVRIVKHSVGIKFTHADPELVDLYEEKLKTV